MASNNVYSQPSASMDSQPQIENTNFDLWLFESADAKLMDMADQLNIKNKTTTKQKLVCKWTMLFKGQLQLFIAYPTRYSLHFLPHNEIL